MSYEDFVAKKLTHAAPQGFKRVPALTKALFPHQRDIVGWALRRGRAAVFLDTGLGKTLVQLEWARCVNEKASGLVLILAPLAVAQQTQREAERFGIDARVVSGDEEIDGPAVYITNYQKLHKFTPSAFDGVVLDESSILKDYTSATRNQLNEAFARTPYKLCCTATPAPNDFTELGNHAQFLGIRTREEMLAEYFVHDGGSTQDWRIKGHAEEHFWRWVSTWAVVVRKPSDLGYDDGSFALPPLEIHEHIVPLPPEFARRAGMLFVEDAESLSEQREVRRLTIPDRVRAVAELVAAEPDEQWLIWCELNDEGDALTAAIPGAVQVAGNDDDKDKEARMLGFADSSVRVLVTKPKIAGFGMNWQGAARMAFVGVSHSFEQFYQAVRREWRFGQTRPVHVHIVATEADRVVLDNLKRKERDARRMAESTMTHMAKLSREAVSSARNERKDYKPRTEMRVPAWLKGGDE